MACTAAFFDPNEEQRNRKDNQNVDESGRRAGCGQAEPPQSRTKMVSRNLYGREYTSSVQRPDVRLTRTHEYARIVIESDLGVAQVLEALAF
jgi:hypothetical protein